MPNSNETCYQCSHAPVCARCIAIVDSVEECIDNVANICNVEGNFEMRQIASDKCLKIVISEMCKEFHQKKEVI